MYQTAQPKRKSMHRHPTGKTNGHNGFLCYAQSRIKSNYFSNYFHKLLDRECIPRGTRPPLDCASRVERRCRPDTLSPFHSQRKELVHRPSLTLRHRGHVGPPFMLQDSCSPLEFYIYSTFPSYRASVRSAQLLHKTATDRTKDSSRPRARTR